MRQFIAWLGKVITRQFVPLPDPPPVQDGHSDPEMPDAKSDEPIKPHNHID